MVAGEASGDLLASHLIKALKAQRPDVRFHGIGGPKMQAVGFQADWPAERLAVRGYAEVLRHYRGIAAIRRELLKRLLADPPDVFIGVDAPDFNLWLETRLKAAGIHTIHFVSPSVWAWRAGRVRKVVRAAHQVLCLFPFEPPLFAGHDIKAVYVGHPLADTLPLKTDTAAARELLGITAHGPVFALLPGSRQSEVQYMGRTYIEVAKLLHTRFPQARFLVPLVSRETRRAFEDELWRADAQELPLTMLFGHAQEAMMAADAILVASGTATLEAALIKKPMVIAYKMSPHSWRIMRNMGYQPWVGLPNILAQTFAVPEFLQDEASAENLAQALGNACVDKPIGARLEALFTEMHLLLRQNTAEKAAAAILPHLPAPAT